MKNRDRSHLRLVVDNSRATPQAEVESPPPARDHSEDHYDNTMIREFKGPFAHLRAALMFEFLCDWGTWQLVGWTRFSLGDPRTWFYSRLEAVNSLTPSDWAWLEQYTRQELGRKWHLHHPHRFSA